MDKTSVSIDVKSMREKKSRKYRPGRDGNQNTVAMSRSAHTLGRAHLVNTLPTKTSH